MTSILNVDEKFLKNTIKEVWVRYLEDPKYAEERKVKAEMRTKLEKEASTAQKLLKAEFLNHEIFFVFNTNPIINRTDAGIYMRLGSKASQIINFLKKQKVVKNDPGLSMGNIAKCLSKIKELANNGHPEAPRFFLRVNGVEDDRNRFWEADPGSFVDNNDRPIWHYNKFAKLIYNEWLRYGQEESSTVDRVLARWINTRTKYGSISQYFATNLRKITTNKNLRSKMDDYIRMRGFIETESEMDTNLLILAGSLLAGLCLVPVLGGVLLKAGVDVSSSMAARFALFLIDWFLVDTTLETAFNTGGEFDLKTIQVNLREVIAMTKDPISDLEDALKEEHPPHKVYNQCKVVLGEINKLQGAFVDAVFKSLEEKIGKKEDLLKLQKEVLSVPEVKDTTHTSNLDLYYSRLSEEEFTYSSSSDRRYVDLFLEEAKNIIYMYEAQTQTLSDVKIDVKTDLGIGLSKIPSNLWEWFKDLWVFDHNFEEDSDAVTLEESSNPFKTALEERESNLLKSLQILLKVKSKRHTKYLEKGTNFLMQYDSWKNDEIGPIPSVNEFWNNIRNNGSAWLKLAGVATPSANFDNVMKNGWAGITKLILNNLLVEEKENYYTFGLMYYDDKTMMKTSWKSSANIQNQRMAFWKAMKGGTIGVGANGKQHLPKNIDNNDLQVVWLKAAAQHKLARKILDDSRYATQDASGNKIPMGQFVGGEYEVWRDILEKYEKFYIELAAVIKEYQGLPDTGISDSDGMTLLRRMHNIFVNASTHHIYLQENNND